MKKGRKTQKRHGGACKNVYTCNALKQQYKLNRTENSKKTYEDQCLSCKVGGATSSNVVNIGEVNTRNLRMAYSPVSPGQKRLSQGKQIVEADFYNILKPKVRIENNNLQLIPLSRPQSPSASPTSSPRVLVVSKPPTRLVKRMVKGQLVNVEEPVTGGRRTHRRYTRRRHTSRRR